MAALKLRRIVVDQQAYLWRRLHRHLARPTASPCAEQLVVYRAGCKQAPLRLLFREDDNALVADNAHPGRWLLHGAGAGVCWFSGNHREGPAPTGRAFNFNRPAVVAQLIKFFLANGWEPATATRPLAIDDALKYVNRLNLPPE